MSKIYKGKSGLKKQRNKMFFSIILLLIIALESIYLYSKSFIEIKWMIGFSITSLLGIEFFRRKIRILSSGLKGENISSKILKSLGKDFTVFNNVIIPGRNGAKELDLVVVSNVGVFVIEVKNYKGKITGNTEDNIWHQVKTSAKGNQYDNEIRNPINQLNLQCIALYSYLKKYKIDIKVAGVVYFSSSEARLFIENRYRIVQGKKQLINYFKDKDDNILSSKEKVIIEKRLKECLQ